MKLKIEVFWNVCKWKLNRYLKFMLQEMVYFWQDISSEDL